MKKLAALFSIILLIGQAPAQVPQVNTTSLLQVKLHEMSEQAGTLNDAAVYFARLYLQTTDSIVARLQQQTFRDSMQMAAMVVAFGQEFLNAVYSDSSHLANSANIAWYNTLYPEREISAMQLIQLAVNAHINYDLAAVLATAIKNQKAPCINDLNQIDAIFAHIAGHNATHFITQSNMPRKQAKKINRWLRWYIKFGKHSRHKVYTYASKMAGGSIKALSRKNKRAARLGRKLLHPHFFVKRMIKATEPYEKATAAENLYLYFP